MAPKGKGLAAEGGERKTCLGILFAHYVRQQTKDKKTQVFAQGPKCYGVSWEAQQRRRRPKHTIDKLDGEFGGARARAPLRLDWACTGVSSYNPNPQKGGGGNVELPICGGVEVIRQSLPNDKRAQSQQQLWEDSSGEHQSKNASQGSGVMGVGGHHPHSHAQNKAGNRKEPNDPFAEAVDFAGKFVVVSVKIVRKMSDNVGLVASVCQKTFKRLFEEKK